MRQTQKGCLQASWMQKWTPDGYPCGKDPCKEPRFNMSGSTPQSSGATNHPKT
jgi:hypothetical protein